MNIGRTVLLNDAECIDVLPLCIAEGHGKHAAILRQDEVLGSNLTAVTVPDHLQVWRHQAGVGHRERIQLEFAAVGGGKLQELDDTEFAIGGQSLVAAASDDRRVERVSGNIEE